MELLQWEAGAAADEGKDEAERKVWPAIWPAAKLDALTLLRLKDQMEQQLTDYKATVNATKEYDLDLVTEEMLIDGAPENLGQDIEEVKVSLQNKTLALERTQLMIALRNKMKPNDNDSRLIMETLKHIVKLTNSVLQYQQQARENEQKLNDIKMRRLSLKKAGRQKLLEIHAMEKKQKEEKLKANMSEILEKIQDNFNREKEMTTVIQNVFQTIILASGVDWAEDPSLKAIVLQLEKNVNFL